MQKRTVSAGESGQLLLDVTGNSRPKSCLSACLQRLGRVTSSIKDTFGNSLYSAATLILIGRYTQKGSITLKQIVNRIKCLGQRSGPIDPLISIRFIIRFRLRTIEVFFVIIINIHSIYNTISHSG